MFVLLGTCHVTDLSKTDQRFLLGYQKINGVPHIYSANDALHLSGRNVNEVLKSFHGFVLFQLLYLLFHRKFVNL